MVAVGSCLTFLECILRCARFRQVRQSLKYGMLDILLSLGPRLRSRAFGYDNIIDIMTEYLLRRLDSAPVIESALSAIAKYSPDELHRKVQASEPEMQACWEACWEKFEQHLTERAVVLYLCERDSSQQVRCSNVSQCL